MMPILNRPGCWQSALLLLAIGLGGVDPGPARAHVDAEPLNDVLIEAAEATAGAVGGRSIVQFRIDNDSDRDLVLVEVDSPLADTSALVARGPVPGGREVVMLSLPSDDSLDFATDHIGVELRGLRRELKPGETVPLRLVFASEAVDAQVHVHGGVGEEAAPEPVATAIWRLLISEGRADTPAADPTARGAALYADYCAACHGANLEGQPDWQSRGPEGTMPPPPHDDSGHTWHHGDGLLTNYIRLGGAAALAERGIDGFRSGMPAFGGTLSDADIAAVIAFIKSRWSERAQAYQQTATEAEEAQ